MKESFLLEFHYKSILSILCPKSITACALSLQSFSQPALRLLNLITPSMIKTWVRSSASEHQMSCQPVPGLLHVSLLGAQHTYHARTSIKQQCKYFPWAKQSKPCAPETNSYEHMTSVPTEVIEKTVLQTKGLAVPNLTEMACFLQALRKARAHIL